jgi:predicted dehydrogenase
VDGAMSFVPDRVLVVGSGSAAVRHVRNLLALGVPEVLVLTSRDVSAVAALQDVRVTVVSALPEDPPQVAVVANDTDRHVATALDLAARGTHVLIEKPLAVGVDEALLLLAAAVKDSGAVVRIAYNLRFLPVFRELERIVRDGTIGRPLFVRIEAGQHLASWRPDRPYLQAYSASTARGGGVALDLSHEIDYMRMLFGHPTASCVHQARSGSLGIESADIFDAIYEFPDGLVCSVHLDYLEPALRRSLRIVGTDGVVVCDLAARYMVVDGPGQTQRFEDEALFDTAHTYLDELVSFLNEVSGGPYGEVHLPTIADGQAILELLGSGSAPQSPA